jgi:DNA polymerase III alpha subunit (gram-positive type)
MRNILFFDFETSGLDTNTCEPTEMAFAVYSEDGKRQAGFQSLIYHENLELTQEVTDKTGVNSQQLKEWGIPLEEVMGVFTQFMVKSHFLCAHNLIRYDYKVLNRFGPKINPNMGLIDTIFDIKYKNVSKSRQLVHLVAEHNRPVLKAHRAMNDVEMLADLFFQYSVDETLARSETPLIYIKAGVTFDTKERAKKLGFRWDAKNQIWFKAIRMYDSEAEKRAALDQFIITKLPDTYTPPED